MANEISSMMMVAQRPAAVADSGQVVRLDVAKTPKPEDGNFEVLDGKNQPLQGEQVQDENKSSTNDLREAVDQISSYVQNVQRDLSFSMDEGSGRTVIKVIDSKSGELIRQIPSDEVLALANYLQGVGEDAANGESVPSGILFSDFT